MPRNKLQQTGIVHRIQNRFLNPTHPSALSESKSSREKAELSSVQTRSDFTDWHVREPIAHRILHRTSTPIRQSNRENISYVMFVVSQPVSKSPSPWDGLSDEKSRANFQPLDSDSKSRTQRNDNYVRTIQTPSTCPRIRSRQYWRQYSTRDSTQLFTHFILGGEKSADHRTFTNGLPRH